MAPSTAALEEATGRQSPADIEDGFYQDIPRQNWYDRVSNSLRLMPLKQRPDHYLRHANTPEKTYGIKTSVTEVDSGLSPSEPPLSQKRRRSRILKAASILIPVTILSFFGILHVLQLAINSFGWLSETTHQPFLPDWGKPGSYNAHLAKYPTDATRGVLPIPVHSHNDYWRRIPLFEALSYGCMGVEADVWWTNGDLLVGHTTSSLSPHRTFKTLYVDPLVELLDKQNPDIESASTSRNGVYDEKPDQTLVLLVDLKTNGPSTFSAVEQQLEGLRSKGYLTYFNGTHTVPGAITVVGTGNTPFDLLLANSTYRDIFFDAPLDRMWEPERAYVGSDLLVDAVAEADPNHDNTLSLEIESHGAASGQGKAGIPAGTLSSAFDSTTSYYASVSFQKVVGRVWRGSLSPLQMEIIRGQIRGAKKRGLKVRYWSTPTWPISLRNHIWNTLIQEGADILNADDLKGAATEDWKRWRHEWW